MQVERRDAAMDFMQADEAYPMEGYSGIPEFDLTERRSYNDQIGKLPFMRFHSQVREDEMMPLPEEHTLDYTEINWELERWTLFYQLPNIMKFGNNLQLSLQQLAAGQLMVPDYLNLVNPPTLWSYFSTLPSWARKDPHIRNVMMAMEYHHPNLSLRAKEEALNFACSFLRPVDEIMKKVLAEACASGKVQLNMELGTKMLTELPFYEIDEGGLGSESEDFEAEDGEQDIESILRMSRAAANDDEEVTPMQAALKALDEDTRLEDMRKITEEDMNIEEFRVQPALNQCMTDFETAVDPTLDDI
jgi:hypothetical protein